MDNEQHLSDIEPFHQASKKLRRRRDLLPIWIKVFIWIFMIFASMIPLALIFGLLGLNFQLSFMGLTTYEPFSIQGILVMLMFLAKGIVAFGLWTEKSWAIEIGKKEAIISTFLGILIMIALPFITGASTWRLEWVLNIFYYNKLNKIEYDWEAFDH